MRAQSEAQLPASGGHAASAAGARGILASASSASLALLTPSLGGAGLGAMSQTSCFMIYTMIGGCYPLCSLFTSHVPAGNGDAAAGAGGWGLSAGLLPGLDMHSIMWGLLSRTEPEDMLSACLSLVSVWRRPNKHDSTPICRCIQA